VKNALALELKEKVLNLKERRKPSSPAQSNGRKALSKQWRVALLNLPADYTAPKVMVPAGQEQFEIVITAPAVAAATDLPNIQFRIAAANGAPLQAGRAAADESDAGTIETLTVSAVGLCKIPAGKARGVT